MLMETGSGTSWLHAVDLDFLGHARRIAAGLVDTPAGTLIVDCGPTSCLPALERGLDAMSLAGRDLHGILLTHVHLDHAGSAGTLVRRHRHLTVYVHKRGAPHLVDPSKLVASATRVYGDRMERLWGEFAPVPQGRVRVVADGDVLMFGDAAFDVAETGGHASHHLCFRDRRSGIVFAGDTGGIRLGPSPYVLPPTPPPDIDVPAWYASVAKIRAWAPAGIFITHYGIHRDAGVHLDALEQELEVWVRLAGALLKGEGEESTRVSQFVAGVRARIEAAATPSEAARYREWIPLEDCWAGLARHLRRSARWREPGIVTPRP
jgi:glyoxylase-like metal-dependent hydrolase (beta-lactamase superfamily II)